ncbi:MAG: hypothetical protein SF051_09300 [Elusimicrobiota bacterium]|nr:hypothetical protein [Elusimicrobiota bacterium]
MSLQPAVRLVAAASLFLTGCAGMGAKPAPQFDLTQPAASQAATFISVVNPKNKGQIGRVAVTSCNLVVADMAGGVSQTDAGIFGETRGRQDKKISMYLYLRGISDEQLQAMTDEACAAAEASLKSSGFDVVPAAEVQANAHYQKLHEGAKSPHPFDPPGGEKYKIFMPKGQKMVDMHYLTTGGGLKLAMAAAAGNTPANHKGRLMDELKADDVHISLKINFGAVEGDQKGFLSSIAKKDTAQVKAKTDVVITGRIEVVTSKTLQCWNRFGKRECVGNGKHPQFKLKYPILIPDAVVEVKDETTKGDKVGSAISGGLSMLAAMSGSRGTAMSVTRKGVVVDPVKYANGVKRAAASMAEMVAASAKGS